MLLLGLIVLSEALFRHVPEHLEALTYFVPEGTARRLLFMIGLLLMYLAEQITRRKRNAWRLTTTLLTILIIFSLVKRFEIVQILTYGTVLGLFIAKRREFVVQNDLTSFRRGLMIALAQLIGAVVLIGLIFALIDQREFARHLTTTQTLHFTYDAILGNPLPRYLGPTRYDHLLIDLLRLTAITSAGLFFLSLFRPLRLRVGVSHVTRARAEKVLQLYGRDSEDFFKLYPNNKQYFFYGDSFVAYAVKSGVALVLDGAAGRVTDIIELRPVFVRYCHRNGWRVALIHCDETESAAWQSLGFEAIQIGSEAVINSEEFLRDTVRNKHFRYVFNRARKDNLHVEWWEPPLTNDQVNHLRRLSQAWIENGRQEYTYIMAPFTPDYLRRRRVAVLHSGQQPVAYANLIPAYGSTTVASIDHMRSLPNMSSVAMHYLLARCIEATAQDFSHFNLGFVPLAKLTVGSPKLTNRLLAIGRRLGSRLYSSQGLEQFKGKFEPEWSPRYLAYQGGLRQLPITANALRQAIAVKSDSSHQLGWPVLLISLAGLCYASFPVAWFLNRPYAFHGLTSALGGEGQPYAWFFNLSDVLSSILSIAVLLWLRRMKRPHTVLLKLTLDIAIVSAICTAIAALVPMPHQFEHLDGQLKWSLLGNPAIVAHGLASFINSAAFVVATILWAIHWRRTDGHLWRRIYVGFTIFIATGGFVVGQIIPGLAGAIQRSFITLYAVWFILLVIDILTAHRHKL